jgi:predicted dehydrogenase
MNRRYFFMSAAVAATAGKHVLASANDTVRIAIVGCGGRGGSHLKEWTTLPNVELVAVSDVDQSHMDGFVKRTVAAGKKAPQAYTDMRKILDDKSIDAISIATPNHWHTLQTIWACQAGKDVYVEKPCTHNIFEAKQIVAAARKYDRMVQQGSQSRSSEALREGVQKLREGVIGDVYLSRGLCYKTRDTIGRTPVSDVPAGVDYDLWTGPAPKRQFSKNRFHYNWHWFWDTGNGDIGNQGIHEMDKARWGLGVKYPIKANATGGHFMFDDDQETPNTLNTAFEFDQDGKKKMLEFEVRHWITNREYGVENKPGGSIGNLYYGSNGYMVIENYNKYSTYIGKAQTPGPTATKSDTHFQNFIDAVRAHKREMLNCEVEEGAASTVLVHLANISYRLGRTVHFDAATMTCGNDAEANKLAMGTYRKPFVVPEKV